MVDAEEIVIPVRVNLDGYERQMSKVKREREDEQKEQKKRSGFTPAFLGGSVGGFIGGEMRGSVAPVTDALGSILSVALVPLVAALFPLLSRLADISQTPLVQGAIDVSAGTIGRAADAAGGVKDSDTPGAYFGDLAAGAATGAAAGAVRGGLPGAVLGGSLGVGGVALGAGYNLARGEEAAEGPVDVLKGGLSGAAMGAGAGAGLGAAAGSIIPGVGTAAGAGVGALIGGTAGYGVGALNAYNSQFERQSPLVDTWRDERGTWFQSQPGMSPTFDPDIQIDRGTAHRSVG